MTDLENIKFMLNRANIQYEEDIREEYQQYPHARPPSPKYKNITCLTIKSDRDQPVPGGYSYFESELVFHDGDLLAIWAWE